MTYYRLYSIRDGHFFCCEDFFADGDQAAVTKSQNMRNYMAAELWSRERQVHTFEVAAVAVLALHDMPYGDLREIPTMAAA